MEGAWVLDAIAQLWKYTVCGGSYLEISRGDTNMFFYLGVFLLSFLLYVAESFPTDTEKQ